MKNKRTMSLLLAVSLMASLCVGMLGFAATNKFTDVPTTYWAYNEIGFIVDKGLFNGTTATTFSPDAQMKRGQLAAVLYRYAGEPKVDSAASYSDVSATAYYANACAWAKKNGIFMADKLNATALNPDEGITRSEFAVMLYNFAKLNGKAEVKSNASNPYTDMKGVSNEIKTAMVNWAVPAGVLNGTSNTTMGPFAAIKRAHVAAMLYRYETKIANPGSGEEKPSTSTTDKSAYSAGDTLTLKKNGTFTVNIGVGEKVYINYGELDGSNNTDWIEYDQNQFNDKGSLIAQMSWDSSKKCMAIEGKAAGTMTMQCLATADYKTVLASIKVTVGSTPTGNGSGNSGSTTDLGANMDIREEIVRLTNEVRKEKGTEVLPTDSKAMDAAQAIAEEYLRTGSYVNGHDMKMETDTARNMGITYGFGGNLLSGGYLGGESEYAQHAVDKWVASSGHFRTMIDSDYDNIGVGVARNGNTWVAYQLFGNLDTNLGIYS